MRTLLIDNYDVDDWLEETTAMLRGLEALPPPATPPPGRAAFHLVDDADRYRANIEACRHQIVEGETYEVCPTTELGSAATLPPFHAYRALRARNLAPFAALVRLGAELAEMLLKARAVLDAIGGTVLGAPAAAAAR